MSSSNRKLRYEFRVWGEHEAARRQLSMLADVERHEQLDDCYLLVDDSGYNAKIRRNCLKIKRLVEVTLGFQRWSSSTSDLVGPVPQLDAFGGVRAVFVTKERCRFRFGSIRAEVTEVDVIGQPGTLRTLAIEGKDLDDLIRLRSALGLAHLPNVALHLAVEGAAHRLAGRARQRFPAVGGLPPV
ncbi:MAG: hypothetical protein ACR2QO_00710 [Acidimicrobiales bacterium]